MIAKMDVVSLLNSGTEAAEQQDQIEKSRTPLRSRTPWDADGYSLPTSRITNPCHAVNTITTSPRATSFAPELIHSDDSRSDSQIVNGASSRHKSNSSRSSLSSSISSLQSTTHSRFSSMSTVNSCHLSQSTFIVNSLSSTSENVPRIMDLASPDLTSDVHPAAHSPTSSLGTLALVAERHLSAHRLESIDLSSTVPPTTSSIDRDCLTPSQEAQTPRRPHSPSDAILIKRNRLPAHPSNTGETDQNRQRQQQNIKYLGAHFTNDDQPPFIKSHKRCVSAPDISATMSLFPSRESMDRGPRAELTPPPSQPPGSSSPTTSTIYPAPDTPPADIETDAVVCMYIQNCDTGSQPRKAISHIFGRNKMCTRLIPPHVWVHYCRKHYQRSRYRNPKEYAKLQCDLVQQQIRRVHEWSVENKKTGAAGIVQDWGLSVRKREKKRLDDLGGANRKRRAAILDRNDDDETENVDNLAGTPGSPIPATAVPDWLLTLCGKGYSTQGILDIFNQLHAEILDDKMSCFPDIEILPNIAVAQDEPRSPKGGTKRAARTNVHRRSQSLGVAMKTECDSLNRRLSESSVGVNDASTYPWHAQKRRRPDEQGRDELERILPRVSRSRRLDPSTDTGRRIQHLAHRPVFANISEIQADEESHIEIQPRDSYARSLVYDQSPLMVANLQGSCCHQVGPRQEHCPHSGGSRRLHGRSQSDVSAFSHGHVSSQPALLSTYSVDDHVRSLPHHSRSQSGNNLPPLQHSTPVTRIQQFLPPGHVRHQSTPVTYQSCPEPYTQSIGPYQTIPYVQHRNNTLYPPRQISEAQMTRDLYNARR